MKKIFYKNLFKELNLNKETYLVTVIDGMNNGKSIKPSEGKVSLIAKCDGLLKIKEQ